MAKRPNIRTRDGLARRLKKEARKIAIAIAARAALRGTPLWGRILEPEVIKNQSLAEEFVLSLYRCCAVSRLSAFASYRETEGIAADESAAFAAAHAAYAASAAHAAFAIEARTASFVYRDDNSAYAASAAYSAAVSATTAPYSAASAAAAAADAVSIAVPNSALIWRTVSDELGLFAEFPFNVVLDGSLWREVKFYKKGASSRGPDTPDWAQAAWFEFRTELLSRGAHWRLWVEWYDAVLNGYEPWKLPREAGNNVLLEALTWPDEKWRRPPAEVNAEILALIEAARVRLADETELLAADNIPSQSPAAIEPLWQDGRLVIAATPAAVDLDGVGLAGALASLKASIGQLADDAEVESNIDRRMVRKLRRLADLVPDYPPDQATLFTLGHAQEALREFQGTVAAEWPDVLAADYSALVTQYEKTVRQFPRWREFARNAAKNDLSMGDALEIAASTERAVEVLRDEVPSEIVDAAIPTLLEKLRGLMPDRAALDRIDEAISGGAEEVALDLLESIDNILKRLAERMIEARNIESNGLQASKEITSRIWNSKSLDDARASFGKNFAKGLGRSSGEVGRMIGEGVPYAALAALISLVLMSLGFSPMVAATAAVSPLLKKHKWVRDLLKKLGFGPNEPL
jgi:hypothetical protein